MIEIKQRRALADMDSSCTVAMLEKDFSVLDTLLGGNSESCR